MRLSTLSDQKQTIAELKKLNFAPQDSKLASNELILSHGGVSTTPPFKEGKLTIQDEAASLVVEAFDFSGDEKVLDACSAPGGKTTQIAEYLPHGQVTALDIHEKKLRLVRQNANRMHVANRVVTKQWTPAKLTNIFLGSNLLKY